MAAGDHPTIDDPGPFDAGWLASRRWFRSRTRPLRAVTLHDRADLPKNGALLVLAAAFVDGREERYLVPIVAGPDGEREPADGDGLWQGLLASMMDGSRRVASRRGHFVLDPGPALSQLLPGGRSETDAVAESALAVEQSNTSIRLGDRIMLKIYRLLEPGLNPEREILEFLTERGFGHAPQAAGSMRYQTDDVEPADAAMVQSLVAARGDAWAWMLERLVAPPNGPVESVAAAAEIGGITAELHGALQSEPERPGFPSRPATADELRAWQAGALAQLEAALDALAGEGRARLAAAAPGVRRAFDEIPSAPDAWVSRVHGDYHLGQLLATEAGFVVTDFEGEPARPLAERRLPTSPLRDVAGMLRSLDYAARTAEGRQADFRADSWLADARSALLAAYGADPESPLLRAFELEKACYEVRYEANFRPDWVPLPLGAIEQAARVAG
jgi:trehalose synthase-fused probable maltokinase